MRISISVNLKDLSAPECSMTVYEISYKEDVERVAKVAAALGGLFEDFKKPVKQEIKDGNAGNQNKAA